MIARLQAGTSLGRVVLRLLSFFWEGRTMPYSRKAP